MNGKISSYDVKTNGIANDELHEGKYVVKESSSIYIKSNGIQEKLPEKSEWVINFLIKKIHIFFEWNKYCV